MSTLLEEGKATINTQDSEGITALHWACSVGHMDTVQVLLMAGANPNLLELDGERLAPLDYAIIGGHQEVAQVLIEHGALSISSIQELAAVQIQKCVRGYLVRRRQLLAHRSSPGIESVSDKGMASGRGEAEADHRRR